MFDKYYFINRLPNIELSYDEIMLNVKQAEELSKALYKRTKEWRKETKKFYKRTRKSNDQKILVVE